MWKTCTPINDYYNYLFIHFSQSQGVLEISYYLRCNFSKFNTILTSITIGYKIVLQIAALVCALLIRKLKVNVLNDSRETVAIIYSLTVLCITSGLILLVLRPTADRFAITSSTMIFLTVVINLGFGFVTKVCKIIIQTLPYINVLYLIVSCLYKLLYFRWLHCTRIHKGARYSRKPNRLLLMATRKNSQLWWHFDRNACISITIKWSTTLIEEQI